MDKQNSGIRAFFSKVTTQERVGQDKLVEERRAERQQRFQESDDHFREDREEQRQQAAREAPVKIKQSATLSRRAGIQIPSALRSTRWSPGWHGSWRRTRCRPRRRTQLWIRMD